MNLYTNIFLSSKKVIHIFGGRTLVLANNTNNHGKFFEGVSVTTKRKKFTSSISIVKNSMAREDITVGAFIGKNIKGLEGVKFQGRTMRRGYEYNLLLCTSEGKVTDGEVVWSMSENGWKPNGHFEIQLWVEKKKGLFGWSSVKPSGKNAVYRYETREEASNVVEICYFNFVPEKEIRILFVED